MWVGGKRKITELPDSRTRGHRPPQFQYKKHMTPSFVLFPNLTDLQKIRSLGGNKELCLSCDTNGYHINDWLDEGRGHFYINIMSSECGFQWYLYFINCKTQFPSNTGFSFRDITQQEFLFTGSHPESPNLVCSQIRLSCIGLTTVIAVFLLLLVCL